MIIKTRLRQYYMKRRQALSQHQKDVFSHHIQQHLAHFIDSSFHQQNLNILCYQSLPSEVATQNIFHQSAEHVYYAPVTQPTGGMHWLSVHPKTKWKTGYFQVEEPMGGQRWQANGMPTLLICPLVAFDSHGNRIGMGKGCFDGWLADYQHQVQHILGLAFSCQECSHIPIETHDIPLHSVITEKG
ncbi:MAG: 5-formyltetrahydrofolate cyclo-ligase, partial [Mariprofundaceae bacterium]|nr:5-formyltetrahydrofolate cyclo-ligase [Mariprofundaceae bacterium]